MTLAPEETLTATIPGFDESSFPAYAEPALIRAKREAALADYLRLPLPSVREEEWRRTDPALFPFDQFRLLPLLPLRSAGGTASPWDDAFDVVVHVQDEGFTIRDRTGRLAAGELMAIPLAEASLRRPDLVERYLQGPARVKQGRKFTALADAFWNFGLFLYVPPRVQAGAVLICYSLSRNHGAIVPRVLAVVGDHAELTLAEHFFSPDNAPLMAIGSRELYAGRGATLRACSLQEWGLNTYSIGEEWVRVERDGKAEWVTILLGGRVSKMMVSCDVHEPNAQALMTGLFFAGRDQHVDQKTLQLHSAPHTYSNLLYKGAVKDNGHSVYQGIIEAARGAVKVDAYQMNNNLILSEGARADSLPGLEIDADDLKCSHGATMGNLDETQLFYLRARGLPEAEARQMLVMAFFEEVIGRVPFEFMRDRVREDVRRKVGGAP